MVTVTHARWVSESSASLRAKRKSLRPCAPLVDAAEMDALVAQVETLVRETARAPLARLRSANMTMSFLGCVNDAEASTILLNGVERAELDHILHDCRRLVRRISASSP